MITRSFGSPGEKTSQAKYNCTLVLLNHLLVDFNWTSKKNYRLCIHSGSYENVNTRIAILNKETNFLSFQIPSSTITTLPKGHQIICSVWPWWPRSCISIWCIYSPVWKNKMLQSEKLHATLGSYFDWWNIQNSLFMPCCSFCKDARSTRVENSWLPGLSRFC